MLFSSKVSMNSGSRPSYESFKHTSPSGVIIIDLVILKLSSTRHFLSFMLHDIFFSLNQGVPFWSIYNVTLPSAGSQHSNSCE